MSPYSYVFDSDDECCARRDRFLSEDDTGCDRYPGHRSSFSFQEASRCTPSLLGRDFDSLSTGCISHLDHGVQDDCLNGPESELSSSDHECVSSALSLQGFSQVRDDHVLPASGVCDSVGDVLQGCNGNVLQRCNGDALQGCIGNALQGCIGNALQGCIGNALQGCIGNASQEYQASTPQRYQTNSSQRYQANPSQRYQVNSPQKYQASSSEEYVRNASGNYPRNAEKHLRNSSGECLKEPYPTTRRETERKPLKSKNYGVMEVKIPPMVRTGHPKQRRGPKKAVTFVADEKPGNPQDIDPVGPAVCGNM